ncbi:MAG: mechanosensitive ion channel domain-containing protein [Ilumatobacteraceae bacterium]
MLIATVGRVEASAVASPPRWVERLDELHLLTPLRIVAIVVVAVIATMLLRVVASRLVKRAFMLPGADPSRTQARQRALSTALRSALFGLIWAAAVITIISEVGVNIGAFVATATVIGGAVAFGAQTLVRDVIAGFFVLAEDQYGVGDSVDVGLAAGTVERITLRSVRLRDGEGKIWYVPHGGVARVGNLSKTTSAQLDIEVARDSRLADLHRTAVAMGEALVKLVGRTLTGPPTVVGLVALADDRMTYRVTVAIRAGHHDEVHRAWIVIAVEAFDSGALRPPG